MNIKTGFEPRDEVWYFKDSIPTKTEIKAIHIKVDKVLRTNIIIKYELLREKTLISEEKIFSSQIDLFGNLT